MNKQLTELVWQSSFSKRFAPDPVTQNYTREVPGYLYSVVEPSPVPAPKLIGWSTQLASELKLNRPDGTLVSTKRDQSSYRSLEFLSGNYAGHGVNPISLRYGGHQFGNWAGQLGDGRAITLGESNFEGFGSLEFQLKGAGPTPYSRRGDGRAVLRSSVREFLCSEAMHFLGIPTTRALSLVQTGQDVVRDLFYDGHPEKERGAIVCRVSPSFLRFGNFQILAAYKEKELFESLWDWVIEKYFNKSSKKQDRNLEVLLEIATKTADLMVAWQSVGFVHGVMNTDNMSILGLTIDYGPFGFVENFDPDWTPNTTDFAHRRYRYMAQGQVALWNLARFCESFLCIGVLEKDLIEVLGSYQSRFDQKMIEAWANKLGLSVKSCQEGKLLNELFLNMADSATDFTLFFREAILNQNVQEFTKSLSTMSERLGGTQIQAWQDWFITFNQLRADQLKVLPGGYDFWRNQRLNVNPWFIPRNWLLHQAITDLQRGDDQLFSQIYQASCYPFDQNYFHRPLATNRPEWAKNTPGCSSLSCSS